MPEFVDLSREIFHRTQTHPSHPPAVVTVWGDHSEKKVAGDVVFTSKALSIAFSDHADTHVDAPVHFDPRPEALSIDQMPLTKFFTSAFCIDLSHVPLRHVSADLHIRPRRRWNPEVEPAGRHDRFDGEIS